MALLTGLGSAAKGATATITLNKTELFALSCVAADDFFSVQSNVKEVKVLYKSTVGGQKKALVFDMSQTNPTAPLTFSAVARDIFYVAEIYLYDFDGDDFPVVEGDIPAGLGINMAPPQLDTITFNHQASSAGWDATLTNTGDTADQLTYSANELVTFRMTFNNSLYVEAFYFASNPYSNIKITDSTSQVLFNGPTESIYGDTVALLSSPLTLGASDYLDFELTLAGTGSEFGYTYGADVTFSNIVHESVPVTTTWQPAIKAYVLFNFANTVSNVVAYTEKKLDINTLTASNLTLTNFVNGQVIDGFPNYIKLSSLSAEYVDWFHPTANPSTEAVAFWAYANIAPTQKAYMLANYPAIANAVNAGYLSNEEYMSDFNYVDSIAMIQNTDKPPVGSGITDQSIANAASWSPFIIPADYLGAKIAFQARSRNAFTFVSASIPYSAAP